MVLSQTERLGQKAHLSAADDLFRGFLASLHRKEEAAVNRKQGIYFCFLFPAACCQCERSLLMKKRTRTWIGLSFGLVLLLLALWLIFSRPILGELPQGYWVDFSAEVGTHDIFAPSREYGTQPPLMRTNPQNFNDPEQLRYMRVPSEIRSLSAENVRRVLRGRRMIPLNIDDAGEELPYIIVPALLLVKQPSAYEFSFTDAQGLSYEVLVTNFGLIGIRSDDEARAFLDTGLCFPALRCAFGDGRDAFHWQRRQPRGKPFRAPAGDTVQLMQALPQGHWYSFKGGAGGRRADGSMQMAIGTALNPPKHERLNRPEGLRDYTPENLQKVLTGSQVRKAEPSQEALTAVNRDWLEEPAGLYSLGVDAFFGAYFQDALGNSWRVLILNNNLIYVRGCTYERDEITRTTKKKEIYSQFFRDDGECYAAMKEAFGDLRDLENWQVNAKEKAG